MKIKEWVERDRQAGIFYVSRFMVMSETNSGIKYFSSSIILCRWSNGLKGRIYSGVFRIFTLFVFISVSSAETSFNYDIGGFQPILERPPVISIYPQFWTNLLSFSSLEISYKSTKVIRSLFHLFSIMVSRDGYSWIPDSVVWLSLKVVVIK